MGILAEKYIAQQNTARAFLNDIYPSYNNLGDERDISGFSVFVGESIANNPDLKELNFNGFYNNWREDYYTLDSINTRFYVADSVDIYYTPNLFKGYTYRFRTIKRSDDDSLMWLNALYIDIDGIDGIYTPNEALEVLFQAFSRAGIAMPNFVIHTSTNPTIRVQVIWLLDPMYLKDENKDIIVDRFSWWKDTASSVIYNLKKVEPRLQIDEMASTNIKGYLRLPGSINQKTGEIVDIIYRNIGNKRYTLEDEWLNDLRKSYYAFLKREIKSISRTHNTQRRYNSDIRLLEHEQIKLLLDNGVPEGYRNKAVYAITKACLADGLSFEDTVKVIEEFNHKCKPPVAFGELLYWIKASYGLIGKEKTALKNINPVIVKNIVNQVFNTEYKADYILYYALRRHLCRRGNNAGNIRRAYISKRDSIKRTVAVIAYYVLTGQDNLPTQKQLALIAGVKYNSITKKDYWNEILNELYKKFGIVIKKVGQANRLVLVKIEQDKLNDYFFSFFAFCLLCKIPYNIYSIIPGFLVFYFWDSS